MLAKPQSFLYIADIHGPKIVEQRGIVRNRSLAGTTKVVGIAAALMQANYHVQVLSFGSPAEGSYRRDSSSAESIVLGDGHELKIVYTASFDCRWMRDLYSGMHAIWMLPAILHNLKVSSLLIYNLSIANLCLALLGKLLGRTIYLEYEDSLHIHRTGKKSLIKGWYAKLIETVFRKITSGSMCASLELANAIHIPPTIIIPGVLSEDIVKAANELKKDVNVRRPIRFIYAGRLDVSKGLDVFLRALLSSSHLNKIEMIICGSGPQEEDIENLSKQSFGTIQFLGLVSRDRLIHELLKADVGINPHRIDLHEGGTWPFKVVEYLATCGTVFCSHSNELSTELANQLYLYKATDEQGIQAALNEFISNWRVLAQAAQQRQLWAIEQFSIQSISHQLDRWLTEANTKSVKSL